MKKLLLVFLLILLSACSEPTNLNQILDQFFDSENLEEFYRQNNFSKYISYYLPSDVVETEYDDLSLILRYDDSKIVFNVNVSGIINNKYYQELSLYDDGFFANDKLIYSHSGVIIIDKIVEKYYFNLYQYDDNYLLHFSTNKINVYAYTKSNVLNVVKRIVIISKSISVDEENIIYDYSLKDVIDYQKNQIDLFHYILPENGMLEELLIDKDQPSE